MGVLTTLKMASLRSKAGSASTRIYEVDDVTICGGYWGFPVQWTCERLDIKAKYSGMFRLARVVLIILLFRIVYPQTIALALFWAHFYWFGYNRISFLTKMKLIKVYRL